MEGGGALSLPWCPVDSVLIPACRLPATQTLGCLRGRVWGCVGDFIDAMKDCKSIKEKCLRAAVPAA